MYNVPSFTLARAIGGVFGWYWVQIMRRSNTPLIIMASVRVSSFARISRGLSLLTCRKGFILGEGFLSIVNLLLQGFQVPHY